jgi:septum site-determining protein MinD
MKRVIGVVSGKGGVGKTTLVANLGVALTKFGKNTTLIDCNVTTSHLAFCFGLYFYPITLNDVLKKEARIKEATYVHSSGVKIIPASLKLNDLIDLNIEDLMSSLNNIEDTDVILLDSAPGLGKEAMSVLKACNEVIFVTIPYLNAISDIVRCHQVVKQLGINLSGIVLNMVRNDPHELTGREIEKLTNLPVISKIPFDKNVQKSLAQGIPTIMYKSYAPSSVEMMKLAANILNERYSQPKVRIFSRFYDTLKESFTSKKNFEIPIS